MIRTSITAFLAATALLFTGSAFAQTAANVLGVDFNVGSSVTFYDNYQNVRSSPVPNTGPFWNGVSITGGNQFSPGSFTSSTTLRASDNSTTTQVGFSLTFGGAYNENPFSNVDYTTALLADYAYTASGATRTLTITGLQPTTNYDLYLYSQNTKYRSDVTAFSVTGTYSSTGSALSATATNSGGQNVFTFVQNNSYVAFTSASSTALRTDGSGQIVVSWVGSGAEGAFNGFQLVGDLTAVPEPSTTAAVLALAMVGFVWVRRRRLIS